MSIPLHRSQSVTDAHMQWCSDWVAWVDNVQGPGAKGAPERERERETKKKMKNRKKEKEEKKRELNFSNTRTAPPLPDIFP